ncbi:MAG: GH36-type glycosyl hydrolase domain-containing protein [Solirubrobacteraceae bacterium]
MLLVTMACLGASPALAQAGTAVPSPLSSDHRAPPITSTYGSGAFGRWRVDGWHLPAYDYTINELKSPFAPQPEISGSRDAFSQIGNDHIVADAFNHGYVQLWSQDRLYQWTNYYDAANQHYSGGYGYLKVGRRVISTLYDDRPAKARTQRRFGAGYYAKSLRVAGLAEHDTVYAPFGNDSLLLHDVTITNTSRRRLSGSYFEYWDVNPEVQAGKQAPRGFSSPVWNASTRTLSVAQLPDDTDTRPLSIFATALHAPVKGYDTDTSSFFGSGTRRRPAAVAKGRLSDSIAPAAANGSEGQAMFALRTPFTLAPGRSVTLRYAYGYAHPDRIRPLLARYRRQADPLRRSEARWRSWLPRVDLGRRYRWLSRELQWDAYTLRSDATYEEACGYHILSQGGYYQYFFGFQGAFRDPLQHMLPMIWSDPWLARQVIEYSAHEQPVAGGQLPYALISMCRRYDLGTSDDLDLWLLWGTAEYALATRDWSFLNRKIPYYQADGSGTLLQHLELAFQHQEQVVGLGAHSEYRAGTTGDWNDFSTEFEHMSESNLVTAQAAYIYPRLALVADHLGARAFASQLRHAAARDLATVKGQYVRGGWFARGYAGGTQLGEGSLNAEPQPWAVLAGAATVRQAARLVAGYRRFLVGIGAPKGPTEIGSALAPSATDPAVTQSTEPAVNGSSEWPGGAWFAVNGWITWALGALAGQVPHAATYAWNEFLRNTLATHARAFPKHWDGVITVDDECASYFQSPRSGCGIGLASGFGAVPGYDTQIMHQPAYSLFDLLKLAGLNTTKAGYRIVPRLPMRKFNIRFPDIGLAQQVGLTRGYLRATRDRITLQVAPPPGVRAAQAVAYANGHRVPSRVVGGLVQFSLHTLGSRPADWAIRRS